MTTHVNMTIDQPLMNSITTRGYKSTYVENPRGGYRKPYVVITRIFDHGNGHYVKPNKVALKYPDFKKDVDPYAHVKVFNFEVKANVKTSKKYIINAFNYTLRDTTSN
jgi:hypothetical protein